MKKKTSKRAPAKGDASHARVKARIAALDEVVRKGKRTRTSKPVKVTTGDLIAMICKAASERWPEDKSRPGIQIAHLPSTDSRERTWYVALHRYTQPMGEGRLVPFKCCNDDLDLALVEVAKFVVTAAPPEAARKELSKLLAGFVQVT